jgi:hypothetical protein
MANTLKVAEHWTEFVASHPSFPVGNRLRAGFRAGKITRLCDCGCNTYDIEVPDTTNIVPLSQPGGGFGSVCEMSFEVREFGAQERKSLEFIVFADARGHFAGLEVDYCATSFPVPENLEILEPPYHVRCSATLIA